MTETKHTEDYRQGYKEGYRAAMVATLREMEWFVSQEGSEPDSDDPYKKGMWDALIGTRATFSFMANEVGVPERLGSRP